MSKEDCIGNHGDKMCFLTYCRCHSILIGDFNEVLQKLDAFCFHYQHVDCLYTLYKYQFNNKVVVKGGQLLDILQKAVHLNYQKRGADKTPSIAKNRLLRKKYKDFCGAPFKRDNRRKPMDQFLQTELNKLKRLSLN